MQRTQSCGPGLPGLYTYTFIDTKIANTQTTYAPFLLRFDNFYKNTAEFTPQEIQTNDNVKEWYDRFCGSAKKEDIQQLVYKMTIKQLKIIKSTAQSASEKLPSNLANNSFAYHLKKNKCVETLDYLIFAKQCEPYVTATGGWNAPKQDIATMMELIKKGKKAFRKIDSHYIRLRYSYQLIRLAHYARDYQKVLELYEYLMPKVDAHESIIYYWIMGHKAGAMKALDQNVEAAYLYALIFKNCPSKRTTAFQSFHIKTDKEWEKCMLMCKNDAERGILYTIRASVEESRAVEEMEAIYNLDPNNENLDLLLLKEMRKLEKDLLGLEFNKRKKNNKRFHKTPRKEAGKYAIQLEKLVHRIVKENTIRNIELWKIADGYIEFLRGDFYAAGKTFDKCKKEVKSEQLKEQLDVFQLALKINTYEELDSEDELEISEMLRDNDHFKKYRDFDNFLYDRLAMLYEKSNAPGKAFLTHHEIADLKSNIDIEIVEELIDLSEREEKTRLEKMFIQNKDGRSIINDLRDLRGTYLIGENQLEAALAVLKKIPREERVKYNFHPFRDELSDCVNCTVPDTVDYDKVTLLETVIDFDYKGRAGLEKGGRYFYLVGLAYYNMSYYGNTWQAGDFYRSGSNWSYYNKENVYPLYDTPKGNKENKDVSTALHYFEKTRLITDDKELAARAAFMAARCEQKQWFNSKECRYGFPTRNIPRIPESYNRNFHILVHDYKNTEFYKQAIEECKFFRAYAYK